MRGVPVLAKKNVMANSDTSLQNKVHSSKRSQKTPDIAMGQNKEAPHGTEAQTDFRQFIYQLLRQHNIPSVQAAHISENAWRDSTVRQKRALVRRWLVYSKENQTGIYYLSFQNIMNFMESVRKENLSFSTINKSKQLMVILRKLVGDPLSKSNSYILEKYVTATFNKRPPVTTRPNVTWDVNVLLDHFIKMGPNEEILETNTLGGKLFLQLLISQMCCTGEAAQLHLSTMKILQGTVEFELIEPTKTSQPSLPIGQRKNLQRMKIKEFRGHPLLCPLKTLMSYIDRTKHVRCHVDMLFILVTTQIPRKASRETLVHWGKSIMKNSGLENYHVSSSRSASSSSVLLMGLTLDLIVCRVGWLCATSFVRHYLKAVEQPHHPEPPVPTDKQHNESSPDSVQKPQKPQKIPLPQTGRKLVYHTPPPKRITEPGDLADPYGFVDHIRSKSPKTLPGYDLFKDHSVIAKLPTIILALIRIGRESSISKGRLKIAKNNDKVKALENCNEVVETVVSSPPPPLENYDSPSNYSNNALLLQSASPAPGSAKRSLVLTSLTPPNLVAKLPTEECLPLKIDEPNFKFNSDNCDLSPTQSSGDIRGEIFSPLLASKIFWTFCQEVLSPMCIPLIMTSQHLRT